MKTNTAARFSRRGVRTLALALVAVLAQVPLTQAQPAAAQVGQVAIDKKIDAGLLALPDGKEVDFWVTFTAKADLRPAGRALGWGNRGQAVVDGLQRTAKSSQTGVAALLAARGIKFESYWIANTGKVTGPKSLMRQLAARPEVATVEADRTIELPEPAPAPAAGGTPAAVDWNVAYVNAPAVWDGLGVDGQGIVVANLDTGVQYDHPALENQYRGNLGGTFDHNYNWFDPSGVCGTPSLVPCDNNRHGTHTMGTIVGDDGTGLNGIGVAPGARWIAVKGCESGGCSSSALLAGGQWLLAPTDLNGQNPRPDLRPNIVNNSWGGGSGSFWYQDVVRAWVAAGIFPVFANGNSGPSCGSAGSPGDYPESYAVGAHTSSGTIAGFSSRSSVTGVMKPDIAAPGDGVRSAVPGDGYSSLSGTSMAAPHVAGAVALMWSAAPSLVSNIDLTREILDATAVDVSDLTCGGTAADNGVWGQGKLDALAAVMASPRGPVGTLAGVVVDQATGAPVAGAQVRSAGGDAFPRISGTSATGTFSQTLAVGTYQVEVSAFGYPTTTAQVAVREHEDTVANFQLVPNPRHAVAGTVRDNAGTPLEAVAVSFTGVPVQPVTTDSAGRYRFPAVPDGSYQLTAKPVGPCLATASRNLVFNADATLDFVLDLRRDSFGYSCRHEVPAYVEAGAVLPLTGDDATAVVPLPFAFSYYGKSYPTAQVSTNGLVSLASASTAYTNRAIPDTPTPNATIYAFWDDLELDASSSVRTATVGDEPNRRFVIEWRNVRFYGGSTSVRFDAEVILDQRGGILLQYRGLSDNAQERGGSATIGLENETGTTGLQYSYNQAVLTGTTTAVRFEAAGSVGNVAPDAVADVVSTVAGVSMTVPVLANDRDPDGGTLVVTGVSDLATGRPYLMADGTVSYGPLDGFSGTDVFTYDIADGRGGTDRASVSVFVAPLATDDPHTTAEDTPVSVPVLANDLNPLAGILNIAGVTHPAYGTAWDDVGGTVRYTPPPDFNGTDTFQYSVRDNLGGFDWGTVTITVSPVNDPPRAVDDSAEAAPDGATTVAVLANDVDVDRDALTLVSVSDPPHGTAVRNADRTVTYRPDPGYAGADSFTYDISDGLGGTSRATVSMTVRAPATTTTSTSTTTTTAPPTTTTTVPPTTTSTVTTLPPLPSATLQTPHSVWVHPSPVPLDGLGTWLATVNDPASGPAQMAPSYQYGVNFGFASNPARGTVALSKGPAGKTAMLSVSGAGIAPQTVTVPFTWTANGFYFLYLQQFDPGVWGALVYDMNANTWTPIGAVVVPAAWGKLSPVTVTAANWTGGQAGVCWSYPRADVVVRSPIGFVGGATADSVLAGGGLTPGVCSSQVAAGPPGWYLYRTPTP